MTEQKDFMSTGYTGVRSPPLRVTGNPKFCSESDRKTESDVMNKTGVESMSRVEKDGTKRRPGNTPVKNKERRRVHGGMGYTNPLSVRKGEGRKTVQSRTRGVTYDTD